jgi:hypothetical protein
MSADAALPAPSALDRLASRATGSMPADAVMPLRPSLFEAVPAAATEVDDAHIVDERSDGPTWAAAPPADGAPARQASTAAPRPSQAGQAPSPPLRRRAADVPADHPSGPGRAMVTASASAPESPPRRDAPPAAHGDSRIIHVTVPLVERRRDSADRVVPRTESVSRPVSVERPPHGAVTPAAAARRPPAAPPHVAAVQPPRQRTEPVAERPAFERPIVHVTIGRVEIRASSTAKAEPRSDARRVPSGEASLDSYLRRRALGGRS